MQFKVEDGALDHVPVIEVANFIAKWGLVLDQDGTIRRRNVGDLTMTELAARGCETDEARKAFVESEGL